MSYYYKHSFSFSDHSLHRIKERLKIKHMNDFEAKDYVMKLIGEAGEPQDDGQSLYFQKGSENLYFVVSKKDKVVVTLTPISVEKWAKIFSK